MADTSEPITKVDSAVAGVSDTKGKKAEKPKKEDKKKEEKGKKEDSGKKDAKKEEPVKVWKIEELKEQGIELKIAKETQKLDWKLNTSVSTVDDQAALKKHLTDPPVKKIDLQFPLGLEVTARSMTGVKIKDALDAIHKKFGKRSDEDLENPVLAGFEWDKDTDWTKLIVHTKKEGASSSSKKKKKGGDAE